MMDDTAKHKGERIATALEAIRAAKAGPDVGGSNLALIEAEARCLTAMVRFVDGLRDNTPLVSDRNRAIHTMRQDGATLREIGERFEITPERVRGIVFRVDALDKRREKSEEVIASLGPQGVDAIRIEEMELSVRSYNTLRNYGIDTIEMIDAATDRELLALQNFGRKSLNEVRAVVREIKARLA